MGNKKPPPNERGGSLISYRLRREDEYAVRNVFRSVNLRGERQGHRFIVSDARTEVLRI